MILIGLGANLPSRVGEPAVTLRAALAEFGRHGIKVAMLSPLYRSIAWPNPQDPTFVNAVAIIHTNLAPRGLLHVMLDIESSFGRIRSAHNAPRTLDLDLLDYEGRIEEGPPKLPHPGVSTRAFVLFPLRDVAPNWRHPVSGLDVGELIAHLPKESLTPWRI